MNQKIARLLWPSRRLLGVVVGTVGVVLLAISLAGALGGAPRLSVLSPQAAKVAASETTANQTTTLPTSSPGATAQTASPSARPTPANTTPTQSANNQTDTAGTTKPESTTISVSLTVNTTFKGTVSLSEGSNQCDVLQQALDSGLISSLTMKYNASLQTYGVYIIDGIGDANSVWWTYKVNGKSPPVGCSSVHTNNGDAVQWQYVKN